MRISSTMMVGNYLTQLNNSYENQTKLMEQSDGSSLHRASDNSIGYSKYLHYQNSLAENGQYQSNVSSAVSWMKTSDSALVNVTDICKTLKEKVTAAANDTNNTSDMAAIGKEMMAKIQEIVADGNAQVGERYVFSGQSDLIQPFTMSEETFDRGVAKTLNDTQKSFFNDADSSGSMSQMLTMNDGTNTYYLNTQTGYFYTKDFVESGYKEKVTGGQTVVDNTKDAAGSIGTNAAMGADQQTFFGPTEMTYVGTAASGYYYDKTSKAYYSKAFVEGGYTGCGHTPVTAADASKTPLTVSEFFNSNGVVKTDAAGKAKTANVTLADGTAKTFSFTTVKQQIVSYNGDNKYISMVKQNGAVQPEADSVNLTGQDVFGSDIFDDANSGSTHPTGAAMINNLLTLQAKTAAGDTHWVSSDGLTIADTAHSDVVKSETKMAARQQAYTDVSSMLDTQSLAITSDVNDVSGTDVAALAVQLMTARTIYNMSLSIGSKILPPSLADYLS